MDSSGPNEIGIDGYIELFDANSGKPLGLTLAVQSKVVSALAGESEKTFDYWCDANDLGYWLSGNTPVILVVFPRRGERRLLDLREGTVQGLEARPADPRYV